MELWASTFIISNFSMNLGEGEGKGPNTAIGCREIESSPKIETEEIGRRFRWIWERQVGTLPDR